MRKLLITMAIAATATLMAAQASATEFKGGWTLTSDQLNPANSGSGLTIGYDTINSGFDLDLNSNTPTPVQLFTLYTPESSVQSDDQTLVPITLQFTFDLPTNYSGGSVSGDTSGNSDPLNLGFFQIQGFFQNGVLTWDGGGLTQVHYGDNLTGLLNITVNGGTFNSGILGLNDGNRRCGASCYGLDVTANFEWQNDPTGVPEPASWALMIGGFGMAGTMLRRRKAVAVAA
jgi:hypothetical protein